MENRQIKFRAWTHESKMTPTFGIFDWFDDNGRTYIPGFGRVYDPIIMQFTGLLDKNGKEIYEGDIIEFEKYWYTYGDSGFEKVKKEVHWQDSYGAGWHFGLSEKDGEKRCSFPFPDCIVIGNIYENPELLTI